MINAKKTLLDSLKTPKGASLKDRWNYMRRRIIVNGLPDYVATTVGDLSNSWSSCEAPSKIYIPKVKYWPIGETQSREEFAITISDDITDMSVLVEPIAFYRNSTTGQRTGETLLDVFNRMRPGTELFNLVLAKFYEPRNIWIYSFDADIPIRKKEKQSKTIVDYLPLLGLQPAYAPSKRT